MIEHKISRTPELSKDTWIDGEFISLATTARTANSAVFPTSWVRIWTWNTGDFVRMNSPAPLKV